MNLNLLATTSIEFPNLHISLNNLPKSFSLFGVDIAFYGVIIAFGMLAGIALVCYDAKSSGQDYNLYIDFAMYAIILSVIGARLYYVVFSWDYYSAHPLEIINIREGGLAIYGGVIAGIITCIVYTKIKKISFFKVADSAVLGLILGQIIGRWGNFFNREAFGGYSNGLLAMALPRSAVRQGEITGQMLEHLKVIDGVEFIQVHPTFLYESLWNLMLLVCLLYLWKHRRYPGQIVFTYLMGYGLGRIWIESLRTDQLLLPVIQIPVSQVVAGIMILVSAVLMIKRAENKANPQRKRKDKEKDT